MTSSPGGYDGWARSCWRSGGSRPGGGAGALLDGLGSEGFGLLRWTAGARSLWDRPATLHRALGPPWPAVDDAALLAAADRWWSGPFAAARRRADPQDLTRGATPRIHGVERMF